MNSVETLFPITHTITDEVIGRSNPIYPYCCIGANGLREALGPFANGREIVWGYYDGWVDGLQITTKENINMPLVKSPVLVTFIIKKQCLEP